MFRKLKKRLKEWAEEVQRREVARLHEQNMKLKAEIERGNRSTDSVNSRRAKSIGPNFQGYGSRNIGADIDLRPEGIHDG